MLIVYWSDEYAAHAQQNGQTALYIASKKGNGQVVELLLQIEYTDVTICKKV